MFPQTLSCLVRMCKEDKNWEERVDGAETLAYLIEVRMDNRSRVVPYQSNIKSGISHTCILYRIFCSIYSAKYAHEMFCKAFSTVDYNFLVTIAVYNCTCISVSVCVCV